MVSLSPVTSVFPAVTAALKEFRLKVTTGGTRIRRTIRLVKLTALFVQFQGARPPWITAKPYFGARWTKPATFWNPRPYASSSTTRRTAIRHKWSNGSPRRGIWRRGSSGTARSSYEKFTAGGIMTGKFMR